MEQKLARSVVLEATAWISVTDIMEVLRFYCNYVISWNVRPLESFKFQIEAPEAWRMEVPARGYLQIGGKAYRVKATDPALDRIQELKRYWISLLKTLDSTPAASPIKTFAT